MPTITVNKKHLLVHLWKNMGDEELKEKISMLGTGLEGMNETEVEVEIFPNRPDYLSEHLFAKALSSFMGINSEYTQYTSLKLPENYKVIVDGSVKSVRPYTVCAVVKGITFDDESIKEIIQMQEKLHITFCRNRKKAAIGIYPLEKIEFPITFRADSPKKIKFKPLESDRELDGYEILSEHPTGKEYAHLLEGMEKYPYFIDANNKILSMPPIINSENTGRVTENTRDIFIECSGFDLFTLHKVLNILVCSFSEMGGEICELPVEYDQKYSFEELGFVEAAPEKKKGRSKESKNISDKHSKLPKIIFTPNLAPQEMKIDEDYVSKKLGVDFTRHEISQCLLKMGIGFKEEGVAVIPPYRADVLHPIDLVEDIAIAYGYYEFAPEIPKVATTGKEDLLEIFKRKLRDILVGFELIEVKNYNLISYKDQTESLLYDGDGSGFSKDVVVLKNSLTIEFDSLRKSILSSAMITLRNNKNSEYPQNFFEIGECFSSDNHVRKITEELIELGVITNRFRFDPKCYDFPKLGVTLCSKDSDFTKIRQVLDGISECLGITFDIARASEQNSVPYIPGRVGDVSAKGYKLGTIGEMHPEALRNFDLEFPVSFLELDLFSLYLAFTKK